MIDMKMMRLKTTYDDKHTYGLSIKNRYATMSVAVQRLVNMSQFHGMVNKGISRANSHMEKIANQIKG